MKPPLITASIVLLLVGSYVALSGLLHGAGWMHAFTMFFLIGGMFAVAAFATSSIAVELIRRLNTSFFFSYAAGGIASGVTLGLFVLFFYADTQIGAKNVALGLLGFGAWGLFFGAVSLGVSKIVPNKAPQRTPRKRGAADL